MQTPQSCDWNNFWQNKQVSDFAQASWSKKRIIWTIAPFLKSGLKVLDAGCGSGFFSKYFCDSGLQVFSLDYAQQALTMAQVITKNRAKTIKEDLLVPNLASRLTEKFDVIFSDGLFEHFSLNAQGTIMQNLISVLSPRGIVVTFVPNRWSPWELIRPFFMPGIEETPFVLKDLVSLHERNQLTILQKGGVNVFPFKISPDKIFGGTFGMLLYTIARKNAS